MFSPFHAESQELVGCEAKPIISKDAITDVKPITAVDSEGVGEKVLEERKVDYVVFTVVNEIVDRTVLTWSQMLLRNAIIENKGEVVDSLLRDNPHLVQIPIESSVKVVL